MRENTDQKNSEYRHFLRSANHKSLVLKNKFNIIFEQIGRN